jgi:hypothetical protein
VFFFDEAHLLFDDAPPALVQRIEQVVRLIRSKGVGVYFCSQFPDDVRTTSSASSATACSTRCALHPARPEGGEDRRRDLRAQPEAGRGQGHHQLGTGEALVSTLQDKGVPSRSHRR